MSAAVAQPNTLTISGAQSALGGRIEVPGDKSISHRALMLGAIAEGTTRIRNFLPANDCLATLEVVRGLGVQVEYAPGQVLVHGLGLRGLREPAAPLQCGGSGTTMRLMAGLLAGQPFYSVLVGNAQLSRRPMDRVAAPLREMGATVLGREGGRYAPLSIVGGRLETIRYISPVASAQVKSTILLAGLFANGTTEVIEPAPSRDHTERMLAAMGASLLSDDGRVQLQAPARLDALEIGVPGDVSSAAFFLVAAAIVPGSSVSIPGVGINPGRIGILNTLRRMGAQLLLRNERLENGEPIADLELAAGAHGRMPLQGTVIAPHEVPGMIDEMPVLAVLATQAEGVTEVHGAAELRVKETDRIATTVSELRRMGAAIEALPDGFRVRGPVQLRGARVSSHGDHRLAMALAVAGLAAEGETVLEDAACIADSFPGFEKALAALLGGPQA